MSEIKQQFGRAVQSLRRAKGLSQETLAERAKVTRPFISLIESGKKTVSLELLFPLAAALEVDACDLIRLVRPAQMLKAPQTRVQRQMRALLDAAAETGDRWHCPDQE